MATTSPRFDYIDIAKSLGMLLIIWGHIHLVGWSNAFVYAFHIPLFFFLSGMVFDENRYPNFINFLKKKVVSLLVPYVIYSVLTWVVWVLYIYMTGNRTIDIWMPLAETFIAQGSGGFLVHNVPLWFVTCLFVVEVAYYFIQKIQKWLRIAILIALPVSSYLLISYVHIFDFTLMPWNIEVAMLAIPFYALGHVVINRFGHEGIQIWVKHHKVTSFGLSIVCGGIVACLCQYNGAISFGHADMGRNVLLTYLLAILGIVMMIVVCILLSDIRWNQQKWMNAIKWYGKNSFTAMAIHNPIKGIMIPIATTMILAIQKVCCSLLVFDIMGGGNYLLINVLRDIVAFVITLLATVVCIVFINFFTNLWNKHLLQKRAK